MPPMDHDSDVASHDLRNGNVYLHAQGSADGEFLFWIFS